MQRLWAIVLVLPLGGCSADQEQQLALCKVEAMRLYPNETTAEPFGKIGKYMEACMQARGYKFTASLSACPYGGAFPTDNPLCYVPTSLIGRLIYRLETGGYRLPATPILPCSWVVRDPAHIQQPASCFTP
jgi:hypothetical protein